MHVDTSFNCSAKNEKETPFFYYYRLNAIFFSVFILPDFSFDNRRTFIIYKNNIELSRAFIVHFMKYHAHKPESFLIFWMLEFDMRPCIQYNKPSMTIIIFIFILIFENNSQQYSLMDISSDIYHSLCLVFGSKIGSLKCVLILVVCQDWWSCSLALQWLFLRIVD